MFLSLFRKTKKILPYMNITISSVGLYYQNELQKKLEKNIQHNNEIFLLVKKNLD